MHHWNRINVYSTDACQRIFLFDVTNWFWIARLVTKIRFCFFGYNFSQYILFNVQKRDLGFNLAAGLVETWLYFLLFGDNIQITFPYCIGIVFLLFYECSPISFQWLCMLSNYFAYPVCGGGVVGLGLGFFIFTEIQVKGLNCENIAIFQVLFHLHEYC